MKLTKAQQRAVLNLVWRDHEKLQVNWTWRSYLAARRKVFLGPGCVMIEWAGMVVGIEPDGYTHT